MNTQYHCTHNKTICDFHLPHVHTSGRALPVVMALDRDLLLRLVVLFGSSWRGEMCGMMQSARLSLLFTMFQRPPGADSTTRCSALCGIP
jgi:hypothetical protein